MNSENLAIISSDPKLAAIWLSALIDGEGCVWIGKLKSGKSEGDTRRVMTIGMTDKEVIDMAVECLLTLKIRHNVGFKPAKKNRKAVWSVAVSGGIGLRKLASVLCLSHHAKASKIAQIAGSYRAPTCLRCGCELDERTPGCEACQCRMKYRRKHNLPNVKGRTGRPPKRATQAINI